MDTNVPRPIHRQRHHVGVEHGRSYEMVGRRDHVDGLLEENPTSVFASFHNLSNAANASSRKNS